MNTVLLVEDDPSNARIVVRYLTRMGGLVVKHTENVDEVMRIAQAGEVDLILMDISLAHSKYQGSPVDGIQLTQMLKNNPQTAALPVILVTAHAMEGDRENFLQQSGADAYISKPVTDYQILVNQIMDLLPEQ
jgi:CheY-like chemotaxis protein